MRAKPAPFVGDDNNKIKCFTPTRQSEDVWRAAQAMIRQNARTAPKRLLDPEAVLLSGGFLTCGYCHKPCFATYDHQRQHYRYDAQSSAHTDANGARCPGFGMGAVSNDLDRAVWDEVIRTFEQSEILHQPYAIWQADLEQGQTSEQEHLTALRSLHAQTLEEHLMLTRKLKRRVL